MNISPITENVLIVNIPKRVCGIYSQGRRFFNSLSNNIKYTYLYKEVSSAEELIRELSLKKFYAVIFNVLPGECNWQIGFTHPNMRFKLGIMHECSQFIVNQGTNNDYDYWLVADPTLITEGTNFRSLPRPLVNFKPAKNQTNKLPVIGSFGLHFLGSKGHRELIAEVCREFDNAIVAIHATRASSCSTPDEIVKSELESCITNPGISLRFTCDELDDYSLVQKLSESDINVFYYNDNLRPYPKNLSGVSSVLDYVIPAGSHILVSESVQFRHVHNGEVPVYPNYSIKQVLEGERDYINNLQKNWSIENHQKAVEKVLDSLC